MADKIRVMIVDDIAETREQLRKLMTFDADIEVVAMAGSGEEAVEIAPQVRPDVVLMDINLPGIDGIVATAKIVELVPAAQVIMLSVQGESDYMRRAMMAGARDYLTKPPGADELLDTVHRVYKLAPKRPVPVTPQAKAAAAAAAAAEERLQQARIITVFSPKGGSGTTTVAVNLSIALQNLLGPDAKIVLADANLQFGDASIFMKLQPTRTLADLAPRADEMDQELLNTILTPHTSGVKLLAAPAAPEDAEIFQESGVEEETGANRRLKQILQFTRQRCDLMIVDTAHAIDSSMLALLDISDLLLVVTRPVIPEIRGARLFIALLQKINYPLENVGLVINSVDNKRMGIQPEAIERAMMPALVHIPLDERIALRAANYGVPFVIQEPRAAISQSFTTLAQAVRDRLTVAEEALEDTSEEQPKRLGFGRLL